MYNQWYWRVKKKFLRKVVRVVWRRKISTVSLYERMKTMSLSVIILKRNLPLIGHLIRLLTLAPAHSDALNHFISPVKKLTGRPKTTWLDPVMKEIRNLTDTPLNNDASSNIRYLEVECSDRKNWNKLVGSMISTKLMTLQWRRRRRRKESIPIFWW